MPDTVRAIPKPSKSLDTVLSFALLTVFAKTTSRAITESNVMKKASINSFISTPSLI